MATRKTEPTPPPAETSRNALVVLTVGCLLVAGLVVWALTRTVEPSSPPPPVAPVADQTAPYTPPPPLSTQPPVSTETASPIQISMNGGPPQSVPQGTTPQSLPQGALNAPSDKASVRRVAAEDLREKLNAGQVLLIDVRDAASYAQGHIPGAMNIPFATVQAQMQSLPRGKEIITYCT